ncbi:MAG: ATP-grasp enzyme, partial [Cyanobacteria bacterium J06621_15]
MAQSIPVPSSQNATPDISLGMRFFAFIQNIATLTILLLVFPINATIVLISTLLSFLTSPFKKKQVAAIERKNVLISGAKMTKALQLARFFHAAGHKVV